LPRVLIVDSDVQARSGLKSALVRADYQVEEAPNGEVAIRLQQLHPFDLLITEIFLPEKDGFETIVELRRTFPDLKILAMSDGDRGTPEPYLRAARLMGADGSFAKPISGDALLQIVQELLSSARSEE
jgi:DNA-binding response OmpR family regulator